MDTNQSNKGELWDVSKLKNWDLNPKNTSKVGFDNLKYQISLGQYKPMITLRDGTVLGGNSRIRAFRELGIKQAWVSILDFEDREDGVHVILNGTEVPRVWKSRLDAMSEYALSDNDQATSYDADMLANLSSAIDIDFSKFSVNLQEATRLSDLLDMHQEVAEDEPPALEDGDPVSKLGEVYQLGVHRLMCGSSTSFDDVDKLMDGQIADMVFTDPPYNVDYQGGMHGDGTQSKRKKIANDKMSAEEFYKFLYDVCVNLATHSQGAFYICMSSSELHNLWKAFTDAGLHWQTYIIWAKNAFTLSRSDYQHQFEPILYGLSEQEVQALQTEKLDHDCTPILYGWNKHVWYGGRKQGDVWYFDKPTVSREHPTMKPVALCARAVKNSSRRDQKVLDLFGGSGSTLMACEQLQRQCFMMELDPHYVDVIRKRYAKFIGREDDWQEVTPAV